MRLLLTDMSIQRMQNNSCPRYHQGSLALFIALLKGRVATDWTLATENFLGLVANDTNNLIGWNYIQELYLHLHLLNVYSTPRLQLEISAEPVKLGVRNVVNASRILCVTLKVPRAALRLITDVPYSELGTPIVHGIIESSPAFRDRPWQNIFSAVQLAFGDPVTSGSKQNGDLQLNVTEDESGWTGAAPLLVSFFVPSWILDVEPHTATVAFGIQSTPQTAKTFTRALGLEINIYQTYVGDEANVYITKYAPNQLGHPWRSLRPQSWGSDAKPSNPVFENVITPLVDRETRMMQAFSGHVKLRNGDAKRLFQEGASTKVEQTLAHVLTVKIGIELRHVISFPAPVLQSRCKLRLARRSSWFEVMAPIARPERQDHFPYFMYPTSLEMRYPVNWNLPYLNLDRLPVLDATDTGRLQWLITHASLMFSTRERTLRGRAVEMENGICGDVRLNFKETLFTILMGFSGLQGRRADSFILRDPARSVPGVLIIGHRLRLDLANRTVALDAAVVPLMPLPVHQVMAFLRTQFSREPCTINVNKGEMRLWGLLIPAFAERCRNWAHTSTCEYLAHPRSPIAISEDGTFLCSCGKGIFPSGFLSSTPGWDVISNQACRIALTPSFSVPYVEGVCGLERGKPADGNSGSCASCGKKKRKDGEGLLRCAGCQQAMYCSVECQRASWRAHKSRCVSIGKGRKEQTRL